MARIPAFQPGEDGSKPSGVTVLSYPISTSEKRDTAVDFSDALRAMKDGKKVQRALWAGNPETRFGDIYAMIVEVTFRRGTVSSPSEPQIVIGYPDQDVLRPFAGTQWDILCDDWEIIDDA